MRQRSKLSITTKQENCTLLFISLFKRVMDVTECIFVCLCACVLCLFCSVSQFSLFYVLWAKLPEIKLMMMMMMMMMNAEVSGANVHGTVIRISDVQIVSTWWQKRKETCRNYLTKYTSSRDFGFQLNQSKSKVVVFERWSTNQPAITLEADRHNTWMRIRIYWPMTVVQK